MAEIKIKLGLLRRNFRLGEACGVHCISELRPTAIDRNLGAGREGRIEPKEEDHFRDFLRRSPALHRDHTGHLLPNLGGLVFTDKHFADDRRVDGAGRHRVDANFARKQLGGERPGE
jgi:hypothetical protein